MIFFRIKRVFEDSSRRRFCKWRIDKWRMENYAAVKRCAGGQRPPLRLRKVQMGYKRCAEVAPYGIIRYQAKPADAVHDHRANELRDTVIPQGPSLPFGRFTLCRAFVE